MTAPSLDPALANRISRLIPFLHDLEAPDDIDEGAFIGRFFEEAHHAGWVLPDFDWMSWEEASAYAADPRLVATADLQTISQLLTVHVRTERFEDGHLAEQVRSGHLRAILRRLRELGQGIGFDPLPNIFELIGRTSSRTEPYHSQFLGSMLEASRSGDRRLFDRFWELAWPAAWRPALSDVSIRTEDVIASGRIDIVVMAGDSRVLGVEVKTQEASTTTGQLERYREGLAAKYPGRTIGIAYLTPFNRDRAGDAACGLHSVREFAAFAEAYPGARHLSWLDLAEVAWSGGELWRQHVAYVRNVLASERKRRSWNAGGALRSLGAFFGDDVAERFWEALAAAGAEPRDHLVDLRAVEDPTAVVNALRVLIESVALKGVRARPNRFPADRREAFAEGPFGAVHDALFGLAEEYDGVWLQGKQNYGLRVAHPQHPGGVSLVTSRGADALEVGRLR